MKQINQIAAFSKAIFKFVFGLIAVANNFFISDTDKTQEVHDSLPSNQLQDPSLNWGDTHDDGWID